jgi:hypothetical protein
MATDSASFGSFLSERPVPSTQHPYPRGQCGRHIEDLFAGSHQLLGQQVAKSTSGLDSPGSLTQPFRPGQQLRRLSARGPHLDLGQLPLIAADGHCCMGRLVGVDPNDHCHQFLLRGRLASIIRPTFG